MSDIDERFNEALEEYVNEHPDESRLYDYADNLFKDHLK